MCLFFGLIRGCPLSWIMQDSMSEKKERQGEKKQSKKMEKTRQIEVKVRSLAGKRDKHDLHGHILTASFWGGKQY